MLEGPIPAPYQHVTGLVREIHHRELQDWRQHFWPFSPLSRSAGAGVQLRLLVLPAAVAAAGVTAALAQLFTTHSVGFKLALHSCEVFICAAWASATALAVSRSEVHMCAATAMLHTQVGQRRGSSPGFVLSAYRVQGIV